VLLQVNIAVPLQVYRAVLVQVFIDILLYIIGLGGFSRQKKRRPGSLRYCLYQTGNSISA
jgi:hypothetical protein